MSKRVANKKGQTRKTPARATVRLGWRKKAIRASQADLLTRLEAWADQKIL